MTNRKLCKDTFELTLAIAFILIILISNINAEDVGCCKKTLKGSICQDVQVNECAEGFLNSKCKDTTECALGCCYNEEEGIYDPRTPKSNCMGINVKWSEDPNCNLPNNKFGCCILGSSVTYVNEAQCSKISESRGIEKDWKNIKESECYIIPTLQEYGACVLAGGNCKMTTKEICKKNTGAFSNFFKDYLCTSQELKNYGIKCESTKETMCVEGKDEVYFKDSCGNPANIYDSSKINNKDYWEKIVSKSNSCRGNDENGNAGSQSCGNCNKISGGICSDAKENKFDVEAGNYYCKPTYCEFEGQIYRNGESWCEYEGKIGNGDDVVGSSHWRYSCADGIVMSEQCFDGRKNICAEQDTIDPNTNKVIWRQGLCVVNNWGECLNINSIEEGRRQAECQDNAQCDYRGFELTKDTTISACVPSYPIGFNVNEAGRQAGICHLADNTCTLIKRKNWKFEWEVVYNKECGNQNYVQQMNNLCKTMGDCAMKVNVKGDLGRTGYGVVKSERLNQDYLNNLKNSAKDVEGQKVELGGFLKDAADSYAGGIGYNTYNKKQDENFANPGLGLFSFTTCPLSYLFKNWRISIEKNAEKLLKQWFGIGKTKNINYIFTCEPWQPPYGGANCEECNKDPLKPCTEYKCKSLGKNCEMINKGSAQELCVNAKPDDHGMPEFLEGYISTQELTLNNFEKNKGFEIKSKDEKCLDSNREIQLGFKTDEPAECRYSEERTEFDSMQPFGDSYSTYEHNFSYYIIDPSQGESQGLNITFDRIIYIKCRDTSGNENLDFYTVNFCIKEGEDINAPYIYEDRYYPKDKELLGYNKNETYFVMYTNELSECRWSTNELSDFDNMIAMLCDTEINGRSSNGYECESILPLDKSENKFYFKCKDQPWLGLDENLENDNDRNVNERNTEYTLYKVETPISIDEILPNEDIEAGTSIITDDIEAITSGGSEEHYCEYKLDNYSYNTFMNTGSTRHLQKAVNINAGTHNITIKCEDKTGDEVQKSVNFNVDYDASSPEIARIYQEGIGLVVVTTEESECRYSTDSCEFDFEKAKVMRKSGNKHSVDVLSGLYYIKCKDKFGNVPYSCSMTAKPVKFE